MIIFTYLFSNTCKKRLAYWFRLHSEHKLNLWQFSCILLNFAYFQQQNTGTYRSKFNFFSLFLWRLKQTKMIQKHCSKEIFVFFRLTYSINKLVETFLRNYHSFFLARFTFCTLYSTFLRVFLLFTFFPAKQCWQMSTPCVDRSFPLFQILQW